MVPGVRPFRSAHRPGAGWSIGAVVAAGLAGAFQVGKPAAATPLLRADLSLDLAAAGALTGVLALVGLVLSLPAGAAVASAGDRRMMTWGLAAIALGSLAGALAPGFPVLLLARVLEGVGVVLVMVAGPAILDRMVGGARRPLVLAVWSCVMPVGIAVAISCGALPAGWRSFWWVGAGVALLAMSAMLRVPPADASTAVSAAGGSGGVRTLARRRAALALGGVFALYSLSFFALFSFMPVLLVEGLGVGSAAAALLSALASLANIIGNLVAGRLLARGAPAAVILVVAAAGMGAAALGVFLPLLAPAGRIALCVAFSAIGGAIPATLLVSARTVATPALAAVMFGLLMLGSNLGQALGPVMVGRAVDAWGWSAAALVVVAASLVSAAAALRVRRSLHGG